MSLSVSSIAVNNPYIIVAINKTELANKNPERYKDEKKPEVKESFIEYLRFRDVINDT